jgi:uncharacterized protein YhbP (UPF0306 family)
MHPEALEFLGKNRVCVIAIEMPDGAPHAATVHFAHTDGPILLFETDRKYRKAEALLSRSVSRASVSVGFEEGLRSKTLQMDGEASLIDKDCDLIRNVYLAKFPEKAKKKENPDAIFFSFKPTWWRFTDWAKSRENRILTS